MAEIDHEVDYYESRETGLGARLEDESDACFALIIRCPESAPNGRPAEIAELWRSITFHLLSLIRSTAMSS